MPKQDLSSRHFQRKISDFCEVRVAPIASKRVLENVRPYLISLIIYRKPPPMLNGRIDWTSIGQACGVTSNETLGSDVDASLHRRLALEPIRTHDPLIAKAIGLKFPSNRHGFARME